MNTVQAHYTRVEFFSMFAICYKHPLGRYSYYILANSKIVTFSSAPNFGPNSYPTDLCRKEKDFTDSTITR
jgi:hypothetical protein